MSFEAGGGLAAWRADAHGFRHRGHSIFFRDHARVPGARRALVLIHGFPTASWDWHLLWPALAERFDRVVAADMIGYGFSDKPRGYAYSIFDQADLHEALLAQLGIDEAHVLAHDYGDTVAQELLARHVQRHEGGDLPGPHAAARGPRLLSAALLNGGLFPEVHRPRPIQKALLGPLGPLLSRLSNRRSFGKSFAEIFGASTQPAAAELDAFWQLLQHNGGRHIQHRMIRYIPERAANRARWVGALQCTQVPLLFVNGPDDPVSGAHMAARWRELLPRAPVVELPGIGHYPQVEAPARVLDALMTFHSGIPR